MEIKIVIMAGGLGKRLWPLSSEALPKQFIKFFDGHSLFQQTLLRNHGLGRLTVMVSLEHEEIARQQIVEVKVEADLILEPLVRNTAACGIIAALDADANKATTVVLLPCDHYISNEEEYTKCIKRSIKGADEFGICAIGITPNYPSSHYGYIRATSIIDSQVCKAEEFIEKPSHNKACVYLKSRDYFWNSGIFTYNTRYFLKHAKKIQGNLFAQACSAYSKAIQINGNLYLAKEPYEEIESISIDYAIMEKIACIGVIAGKFQWSDLGNWNSLWRSSYKDENSNHLEGNVITKGVTNSYIKTEKKLTTVLGLNNVIVINTKHALLIADKSMSEEFISEEVKRIATEFASQHTRNGEGE